MSRTHMVVVQHYIQERPLEIRVLVSVNSARAAAVAALKKLCPLGVIQENAHDIVGATVSSVEGVFTVSSVKSIHPSHVLILSTYFPIHAPKEELDHQVSCVARSCSENQEELSCRC